MKVLNLGCPQDHRFEGWFGSDADFESQLARQLVSCPICNDTTVKRLPTAPRLNISNAREPETSSIAAAPDEAVAQAAWLHAMRYMLSKTDNVGERFAEEARRIHYGEIERRAIRGRTTPEEVVALEEEGIEVISLAIPAGLDKPVQ